MQFTEIVAPTVKELFIQRIENLILSGELEIGEQLPSERELAEQMHISKTVVHSGIADMVRKGFLEAQPRKGVFVGDYARNGTLEALVSIMQHNGGQLDERNTKSMLEMRYAVESIAVEHVMEEQDEEVYRKLKEIVNEAVDEVNNSSSTDYNQLAEIYFKFHHYICVASGNTIAPLIMNAFHLPAVRLWTNSARALGAVASVERLCHFYDLILQGETEEVCRYLRWIIDSSDKIVRE